MWRISIDTGGTFTDCIGISPEGQLQRIKVLSSSVLRGHVSEIVSNKSLKISADWPVERDILAGFEIRFLTTATKATIARYNIEQGVLELTEPTDIPMGLFEISSGEEVPVLAARLLTSTALDQPFPAIHMRLGSTRGTNTLLERKGAKTTLLVNEGFGDLLEIRDQTRPELFNLHIDKPHPYYSEVIEISGRQDAQGNITTPIDEQQIDKLFDKLLESHTESLAVSLIHSYKNPALEKKINHLAKEKGLNSVSISSDLSRSVRYLDRTETCVVNAYLQPVITEYLTRIVSKFDGNLRVMSSAGGLMPVGDFKPKDSLLSGPAGGVVGAAHVGKTMGKNLLVTLDMGGTSTDVALYPGEFDYRYVTDINDAKVQSPALAIDTIAAGGGSIISFDGYKITVGPESAGANPGPACYGAGGPLTLTDLNVLSGRINTSRFNIPLDVKKSEEALEDLIQTIEKAEGEKPDPNELIKACLSIANEMMAEAIRKISLNKGLDPSQFVLLSFGGAGGQHALDVAELLNISEVIAPYEAGILSARGIHEAEVECIYEETVLAPLNKIKKTLNSRIHHIHQQVLKELFQEEEREGYIRETRMYMRFLGQEDKIEVSLPGDPAQQFKENYQKIYGHWMESDTPIEVESIKVIGALKNQSSSMGLSSKPQASAEQDPSFLQWESLELNTKYPDEKNIHSKGLTITSENSTLYVKPGWSYSTDTAMNLLLKQKETQGNTHTFQSESIELELFTNRFRAVVEEMGTILQRCSFSVNIKDRVDFSCALLDAQGKLIVNAPHIPVHLGSMGVCVREVTDYLPLQEGDICITNHPAFGGSHLPDVTLIAPFYYQGELIGYVANRAHHAEIGGKSPGSMPADAKNLYEEGVVIAPFKLAEKGEIHWEKFTDVLTSGRYPTRNKEENLADIQGGIASIHAGLNKLTVLCEKYGVHNVKKYLSRIYQYASQLTDDLLKNSGIPNGKAEEQLDDGTRISLEIYEEAHKKIFDFQGSSPTHPGNLNATPAIINSAVLYVIRTLLGKNIPLNEGIMEPIEIRIPTSFLNPEFRENPTECPAVVGGNTEVSQRVVDTLYKALALMGCSQGTMNNLLFGNRKFGYYETLCGGAGAGKSFNGASGVHTNMTNTRITDPEIMELRYPVVLQTFGIRKNSGGAGKYFGGDGIIRALRFTDDVTVTLLTQHRVVRPFGMKGGKPGKLGSQYKIDTKGKVTILSGSETTRIKKGETIVIETPGGGGYGAID